MHEDDHRSASSKLMRNIRYEMPSVKLPVSKISRGNFTGGQTWFMSFFSGYVDAQRNTQTKILYFIYSLYPISHHLLEFFFFLSKIQWILFITSSARSHSIKSLDLSLANCDNILYSFYSNASQPLTAFRPLCLINRGREKEGQKESQATLPLSRIIPQNTHSCLPKECNVAVFACPISDTYSLRL